MNIRIKLYTVLIVFLLCFHIPWGNSLAADEDNSQSQQDSPDKKSLLNGRIWFNRYTKAQGDQFFLSGSFLKGSVTFNDRKFGDLDLLYDILNDEVLLKIDSHPVIILNKEMCDSFTIVSGGRSYYFFNAGTDSSEILRGYINILYDGPSSLYIKYTKKIQPLAVDGRYDLFVQEYSMYLKYGDEVIPLSGKKRMFELMGTKKDDVRHYIKSKKLKISQKDPDSFVPALKYYDGLVH